MTKRPISITAVGVFLIVVSAVGVVETVVTKNDPTANDLMRQNLLSIQLQYDLIYLGLLVKTISALGVLRGKSWARLLYAFSGPASIAIVLAISPMEKVALLGPLAVYAILMFFLFRPESNEYFQHRNP